MDKGGGALGDKARKSANRDEAIVNVCGNWMWFLLGGVSVAVAAVVYWGFFGAMVDRVNGRGVTIQSGGISAIVSHGAGILEHLNISPESDVSSNQIVGQIYNAEYFFRLRKMDIEQREMVEQMSELLKGQDQLARQKVDAEKEKESSIKALLAQMEESRKRTTELSAMHKRLEEIGAGSKASYYGALEHTLQSENSIVSTVIQRLNHMSNQYDISWQNRESQIKLNRDLLAKQQEMILALKTYCDATWLRAPENGVVIEIMKRVGESVNVGDKIALISNNSINSLILVGYIPLEKGKKVKAGMSAYFSPGALPASEYGYMAGVVVSTSPFPVSQDSICSELKNADVAKVMTAGGAQMRIEVELIPDSSSASGVKWTSRNGRNATIEPGMFGSLQINTEYRKPVSYIVPYLREKILRHDKD